MTKPQTTEYYVGDLCYVLHEVWEEVCDCLFPHITEGTRWGTHTLSDGRVIRLHGTAYGDGTYLDNHGREYGVDAGLIGCIAVSDIADSERDSITSGAIYNFVPEMLTSSCVFGTINFHDTYTLVSINTAGSSDDSPDEDFYYAYENDYSDEPCDE
jgi:hypothetical protein